MSAFRAFVLAVVVFSPFAIGNAQQLASIVPTDAALPDAPSAVAAAMQQSSPASPAGTGRISGTVLDINGSVVPGARVTLVEVRPPSERTPERVVVSDGTGRFLFDGLAAGRFRFTITAQGLETFVSPDILLKLGEVREMPQVSLPIASANTEVQVVVTQVQIAQEQIHAEEKQRVLGVLPNFYSSYIWNAAPMSSKQKFGLATRSVIDPTEFLGAGAQAAAQYYYQVYPGYGYGVSGYAKRYAAAYGDGLIARMIGSAVLPSILHQDPRYFYRGTGSKKSRALYAIAMAVVTKTDNGRWAPNYSHVGGSFIAGAISNAYHPAADRGIGLTLMNGFIDIGGNAAQNLIREFLLRDLTPSVPDYAKGKP